MSPTTRFNLEDNDYLFNEIIFNELNILGSVIYAFLIFGAFFISSMLSCATQQPECEEECEEEECEEECEEEECEEEEEDEPFIIFPDTLEVSDDGDVYLFKKFSYIVLENGSLEVVTGNTLKKLEAKSRRQARKEQKQREKEEIEAELIRIADESHLRDTISRLNAILENHPMTDTKVKRKQKSYSRPLDYGHRYLQDQDQLTTTLRGQTVDVLYRKGASAKDDRYIAVFAGTNDTIQYKSLNQVAAELARRVTINGPNAWASFKRVKPNGQLESIERLDIIE